MASDGYGTVLFWTVYQLVALSAVFFLSGITVRIYNIYISM